jgi:hypothetical protein
MLNRNRRAATSSLAIFATFIAACTISADVRFQVKAGPPAAESYSPVAPAHALVSAARLNLKLAGDWLGDGDCESAAETAQRILLLLDLCEVQSREQSWQHRVNQLRSQCDQLVGLAKNNDMAGSLKAVNECFSLLASLEADFPRRDTRNVAEFTPRGSLRNWMKLLDGSYTDAKVAKSLDELSAMAYSIAEATHAARFLRNDPEWRERASDAREAALKVATLKPDTDLKVARQELKNVFERCQACHKVFKR